MAHTVEHAVAMPKKLSVEKKRTESTLAGNLCLQAFEIGMKLESMNSRNLERIWDELLSELYLPNCELDGQLLSAKPEILRPTCCQKRGM
jgi:hypothetical protein